MPGLHLTRSNSLLALGELLARTLDAHPLSDPFAPEWVVLGNKGLETWLVQGIAQQVGVCAHVQFPFAMPFLQRALASVEAARAGRSHPFAASPPPDPWSTDALTWAILDLLPGLLEHPVHAAAFSPVEDWVRAAPPADPRAPTRRRYALARRVAQVFDTLLAYRPEQVLGWSAGRPDPTLPPDLAWQPVLWRAVEERVGAGHLARRLQALPALLDAGPLPADFPERVSVFGLSTLAPAVLRAFGQLARHIDVDLLLLHPSRHLWEHLSAAARRADPDAAPPNRLLASFGRLARAFQHQLLDLPQELDDRTALREDELWLDPAVRAPQRPLARLQSDVVHLRQGRHAVPLAALDEAGRPVARDASIQLHRCHGLTRQVEVLRDTLLGLLDDDPTLQPRDILVLSPQMEAVAPLVSAVFDQGRGAEGGPPHLPYRIEDLSFRRTNPVAAALLAVLHLVDGRLEASAVLDLLAREPVQLAFDLRPDEVPAVQALFKDAGARWGADAAWRASFDQPHDPRNTWAAAMDRIALGATMADDWQLWAGAAPYDAVEGGGAHLAGRALAFVAAVLDEVARLREPRTLVEWMDTLLGDAETPGTLERLTRAPDHAAWLLERTRRELEQAREQAIAAGSTTAVGLATVRAHLEGRFEVLAPNPRTPGGAVTFAALRAMRAVPHAVVCLLGMDDGAFPRIVDDPRFDPTARRPGPGDRDVRDEDRFAFLEAILAAREALVLTWTGREPRTDDPRPPCGPVAELLDILDQSFEPVQAAGGPIRPSEWLAVDHPLQAFSPARFQPTQLPPVERGGRARPASFDAGLCAAAQALGRPEAPAPFLPPGLTLPESDEAELDSLTLDELAAFWQRPVRWLLRHRLGLSLRDEAAAVPDREPQLLDGLERWQLAAELSRAADAGVALDAAADALLARGGLPLGHPGDAAVQGRRAVVQAALALEAAHAPAQPRGPLPLQVECAGVALVGEIAAAGSGAAPGLTALERVVGSPRLSRLLAPWIRLLAWTVADAGAPRLVLVVHVHEPATLAGLAVPGASDAARLDFARAELERLVAGWRIGRSSPLPVFERTSAAFAEAALDKAGIEADTPAVLGSDAAVRAGTKAATGAWFRRGHHGGPDWGEGLELPLQRIFGPPDAWSPRRPWEGPDGSLDAPFAEAALSLWRPVLRGRAAAAPWIEEASP